MDNDDEDVADNQKYSFLLGSALRNEDPEQFLSIYDRIIPTDIPANQVKAIKDKARHIADLPEEDFNQLVLKARDFSLAQDRTKVMSHSAGGRCVGSILPEKSSSEDEDDDEVHLRPYADPKRSYNMYKQESCILDVDQYGKRADNDSGFCNSSKATTSIGSYSDHEDTDEDNRGCFDYFPHRSRSAVKIHTPVCPIDFDEAHDVESEQGSVNDIESPRSVSDFDTGIELRTYSRQTANNDDDFETSDESDTEVRFNPHRKLYGEGRRSTNYYTPMDLESVEDYGDSSAGPYATASFSFEKSQHALQDRSSSTLREASVDEQIPFPMYSRHNTSHGTTYGSTSENVRIEKSSFYRGKEKGVVRPPFGSGIDTLNKVGNSIESLISGNKQTVDGMPEGRPISQTLDLAGDNRRKSKKKKRTSKDDLDDRGKIKHDLDLVDENGNPSQTCESVLPHSYRQMREPPPTRHIAKKFDTSCAFPASIHPFNDQPLKDLEESNHTVNLDRAHKRKKAKKDKGVERKAEDVENYVGNKGLDELLSFIESNGTGLKKKPADTQAEKNKKNKKPKGTVEKLEVKSIDKKDKDGDLVIKENHEYIVPPCVSSEIDTKCENGGQTMGNSSVKEQNTDNDSLNIEESQENSVGEEKESNMSTSKKLVGREVLERIENKVQDDIISVDLQEVITDCMKPDITVQSPQPTELPPKKEVQKDNSVVMSNVVKENNIKNSKKKLSAAKSNSLPSKDAEICVSKDTNGPKALASNLELAKTEALGGNSFYIFTDIDTIKPVEEEFKVVGKKKKKGVVQQPVKEVSYREMFSTPHTIPKEEKRRPPRSSTPPPSCQMSVEMEGDHNPDLSLTAFPTLNSARQGRPTVRDGRRNSTGDVPKEVSLKSHDDSDIESVKSLPVAGQALSPRLPMSYAMMAASPKPSGASQNSLQQELSGDETGDRSADLKSAVWKGSITERRHSIGSSPEGNDLQAARQKFGSQELVKTPDPKDVANPDPSDPPDIGTPQETDLEVETPLTDFSASKSTSHVTLTKSDSKHNMTESNSASCANVTESNFTSINVTESDSEHSVEGPSPKQDSSGIKSPLAGDSVPKKVAREKLASSASPQAQRSQETIPSKFKAAKSYSLDSPKSLSTISAKSNIYKKATKSNQSVVFCDKRVTVPQNLDITFGFLDDDTHPVAAEHMCVASFEDLASSKPKLSSYSDSQTRNNIHHKQSFTESTHEKPSVESRSPNKFYSEFNHRKAPKHLEGKNGIINHKHVYSNVLQSSEVGTISFMSEEMDASVTEASKVSDHVSPIPDSCSAEKQAVLGSCVLVHFGESVHTKDTCDNQGETTPCGQIRFLPEENVETSPNYNRDDVTRFLSKAWDNVLSLEEKGEVYTYTDE